MLNSEILLQTLERLKPIFIYPEHLQIRKIFEFDQSRYLTIPKMDLCGVLCLFDIFYRYGIPRVTFYLIIFWDVLRHEGPESLVHQL